MVRRFAKYIVYCLLLLGLLLTLGITLLPHILAQGQIIKIIEVELSKLTGFAVSCKEPPHIVLGMTPTLGFRNVIIASQEVGNTRNGYHIGILEVSIPLAKLIKKQYEIETLTLKDTTLAFQNDSYTNTLRIKSCAFSRMLESNQYNAQCQIDFEKQDTFHHFSLKTKLNVDPQFNNLILTDTQLNSGSSDLSGQVTVQFKPLSFHVDVRSQKLDLNDFSREKKNPSVKHANKDESPLIPLDSLSSFSLTGLYSAHEVIDISRRSYKNISLELNTSKDALYIPKFSMQMLGGDIHGSLNSAKTKSEFQIVGKSIKLKEIAELFDIEPFIQGPADLTIHATTTSLLPSQIKNTLHGSIELNAENAEIESSMLNLASTGLFQILSPLFGEARATPVECLLIHFDLSQGVVRSREQAIKVGDAFIFSNGAFNYIKDSISYNFHVSSHRPSIASLVPPFQAVGALSNPTFLPTVSGTVASAFDTTEGIARSTFGLIGDTIHLITGEEQKKLRGLEVCRAAYKADQELLSSKIGRALN